MKEKGKNQLKNIYANTHTHTIPTWSDTYRRCYIVVIPLYANINVPVSTKFSLHRYNYYKPTEWILACIAAEANSICINFDEPVKLYSFHLLLQNFRTEVHIPIATTTL